MLGRAERRRQPGTEEGWAYPAEELLVIRIGNIADGEPTSDELGGPRVSKRIRIDVCDHVLRAAVCLRVGFRQVALAVILHQLLKLLDLAANDAPGVCFRIGPVRLYSRQVGIGLPSQIPGVEPTPLQQPCCIKSATDSLTSELPPCPD